MTLAEYYADPNVQNRIREYCGGAGGRDATCVYVAGLQVEDGAGATWTQARILPSGSCEALLDARADVARSMWDRDGLMVHLDVDYQNIDAPAEPYHHAAEVFNKIEPVYGAAVHVLRRFDMPLLDLITGRGYHFTGRVPLGSGLIDRLGGLVDGVPSWFDTVAARRQRWMPAGMGRRVARAYAGIGLLVEFLTHRILARARRRASIPIVLNGTIVGSGTTGRECVSLDVSYAGDPLDVRHMRVAFGAYQKHRMASAARWDRPPFVVVPRGRASLRYLLERGREPRYAVRAARMQSAVVPNVEHGVGRLLDAYAASPLARFHRAFYATPTRGPSAFDALVSSRTWDRLPECVKLPLLEPNDRLLQPAVLQHLTRVLLAEGVAPRDIAGIVHARYAVGPEIWGRRWSWLDPQTRAEFDVRVFAGLLSAGIDRAVDFNCRSAQEKNLCPWTPCAIDLRTARDRLLASSTEIHPEFRHHRML